MLSYRWWCTIIKCWCIVFDSYSIKIHARITHLIFESKKKIRGLPSYIFYPIWYSKCEIKLIKFDVGKLARTHYYWTETKENKNNEAKWYWPVLAKTSHLSTISIWNRKSNRRFMRVVVGFREGQYLYLKFEGIVDEVTFGCVSKIWKRHKPVETPSILCCIGPCLHYIYRSKSKVNFL